MNKRITIRVSDRDFHYLKSCNLNVSQWVRSAIKRYAHEMRTTLNRRIIRRKNEPKFKDKCYSRTKDWKEKKKKDPIYLTNLRLKARNYARLKRQKKTDKDWEEY